MRIVKRCIPAKLLGEGVREEGDGDSDDHVLSGGEGSGSIFGLRGSLGLGLCRVDNTFQFAATFSMDFTFGGVDIVMIWNHELASIGSCPNPL